MIEIPPSIQFQISKIEERLAIKAQLASHYFVRIDEIDYSVRAKTADIDPITITTDDKKIGLGGIIYPTGAGPATFQGDLLEDEKGTTHKHMTELASRIINPDKTANLPYDTDEYGKGYLVDLIVGYYNRDGEETLDFPYRMFITSEKIGLSFEEAGSLWIPVDFTQFFY